MRSLPGTNEDILQVIRKDQQIEMVSAGIVATADGEHWVEIMHNGVRGYVAVRLLEFEDSLPLWNITATPDLVGLTQNSAHSNAWGFTLNVTYEESDPADVGRVISQFPRATVPILNGGAMEITVGVAGNANTPWETPSCECDFCTDCATATDWWN
jgi:hypothetical protein